MVVALAAGVTLPVRAPAQETSEPVQPRIERSAAVDGRSATVLSRSSRDGNAAKPKLPGATLSRQATDRNQPVTNPNNVVGEAISPECPFLTQTLNELMAYARVNYVNLYRLALTQRRAGASQEVVRQSLAENLCLAEGMGSE